LVLADAADADPWRRRHRAAVARGDTATLKALGQEAGGLNLPPTSICLLAKALRMSGLPEEAVALLRQARDRYPDDFWVHFELGSSLIEKKDWSAVDSEEQVGCWRAALALRPDSAAAHNNLGAVLRDGKKDLDSAIREYRRALDLDPKYTPAHNNLGLALCAKQDLDGAIVAFRQAIALAPKLAPAHTGLGLTLLAKGDLAGAIAACQEAIALDPKYATAHNNLGLVLYARQDLDGAIAAFRRAIALDPKLALAHTGLGMALLQQGRFAEARAATRRSLELLPPREPARQFASQQLQQCERLLALEEKLPAVLKAEARPADAAEAAALAECCVVYKRHPAAAARLYAEAFAADPRLANDPLQPHRYNAACAAALAAAGRGEDAKLLPDKEVALLRRQALAWLRADLAARRSQLKSWLPGLADQARQALAHWQQDPDLAGLRDKDAVAKLPADEQPAWRQLWTDVEALLQKAQGAGKEK
jgi:tetratricopeptide (TPR) repeat protein